MTVIRALSLGMIVLLACGCAAPEPAATPTVYPVSAHFRADARRTWGAVLAVLSRNHYQVTRTDPASGLISTKEKEVGLSPPRGLFRKRYPLVARITVWVKPRGAETYVTVTNEEVIMVSQDKRERFPTTTELEHEILVQVSEELGVRP